MHAPLSSEHVLGRPAGREGQRKTLNLCLWTAGCKTRTASVLVRHQACGVLRPCLCAPPSAPPCLQVSPDGSQFATVSPDGRVRVFWFATGKLRRTYDESMEVRSVRLLKSDESVVVTSMVVKEMNNSSRIHVQLCVEYVRLFRSVGTPLCWLPIAREPNAVAQQ